MNKIITVLFLLVATVGFAQTADEVNSSGGVNDVFYDFETKSKVNVDRTTWDIGLTTDMRGASIIINENGGTELYLYSSDTSDWSAVDTAGYDFKNVYNSETTWNAGAFANQGTTHPDYGWGTYNMNTHDINGNRIFILKTKTGKYLKVVIDKMSAAGVYTFRTANLDGSNHQDYTYSKTSVLAMGKNFALIDMDRVFFVNSNPARKDWDILFTKYITYVQAGPNSRYQPVGGVKVNIGCEVAQRDGVDVSSDDTSSLTWNTDITEIGWDWKTFDLNTSSYSMVADRAYFVRTQNGDVYKIWFTDYSVGTAIYKFNTKLIKGGITSTAAIVKLNTIVYPNPSNGVLNIENKENETLTATLINAQGMVLDALQINAFTTNAMSTTDFAKGIYFLQFSSEKGTSTQRVIFE